MIKISVFLSASLSVLIALSVLNSTFKFVANTFIATRENGNR